MSRLRFRSLVVGTALVLAIAGCDSNGGGSGGSGNSGGTGGSGGSGGGGGGHGGNGGGDCGNGTVDSGEDCDGDDFDGEDCADYGNYTGNLTCTSSCRVTTDSCEPPAGCGNGVVAGTEECDDTNLNGKNCQLAGTAGQYIGGDLSCRGDCTFDETGCNPAPVCGNNTVEAGEDCDGTNLGGGSCHSVPGGYNTGALGCDTCQYNTTNCAFDPCADVDNACAIPGLSCQGSELVACAKDAFGCLVETRTNCAAATNGACDSTGAAPVCTSDDPCNDACAVVGEACVGDALVTCATGPFGCNVETNTDCTTTTRGFCDDSGTATCDVAPDPCAGLPQCAAGSPPASCQAGTNYLIECNDLGGCLERVRSDCGLSPGGFCNDEGFPACDVDPCFGKLVCAGGTELTECQNDFVMRECAFDGDGCLIMTLTDCQGSEEYCSEVGDPHCQPPVCGNSNVEPGEQCDPPNGETCNADCTFAQNPCGNGTVDPGESCEPPGTSTCDSTCHRIADCGNGVIDSADGEQCDPPNGTTCDSNCHTIGSTLTCENSGDTACSVSDPTMCVCYGCNDNGNCENEEDCVCPDCLSSSFCMECVDNAACDPYFEGCGCTDCSDHPACATAPCSCDVSGTCDSMCSCDPDCGGPVCGNSIREAGEQCDPPNGTTCSATCQTIGGAGALGNPCTTNDDCPGGLCIDEQQSGWPGGVCSQDCSTTGSCPGGFMCLDFGGGAAFCLETCTSHASCNTGSGCNDLFFETPVCLPACTSNAQCPTSGTCNQYSGFCAPTQGLGLTGAACADNGACESQACLPPESLGTGTLPGGYCSSACKLTDNDCPGDGVCVPVGLANMGLCLDGCVSGTDCRSAEGYQCADVGVGANVCF